MKTAYSIGLIFLGALLSSCTQELLQCGGPEMDLNTLAKLRKSTYPLPGPKANLVMPNPLDATRSLSALPSSPSLMSFASLFALPGLSSPTRLENTFVKVRRHSTEESATVFSGSYDYSPDEIEYSEEMAYYATNAILLYVEALGFPANRTRPLYVLVRAPEVYEGEVNALYEHNAFSTSSPRIMHMVGEGDFAPALDRDMYWHEFGHLMNESITRDRGMDNAGSRGANFTEAAALHECMADYLAESVGEKNFIGRWIARNFEEYEPGDPLRSAVDRSGERDLLLTERLMNNGSSRIPERYSVAELCTRVLWEIRSEFTQVDRSKGPLFADRMILNALSLLGKDTSLRQFAAALLDSDKELHCGLNQRSIQAAFEKRGFDLNPKTLKNPLNFVAQPVGIQEFQEDGVTKFQQSSIQNADYIYFSVQVSNNNSVTAHNVRIYLESKSSALIPDIYMQGLGDIPPGQSVRVNLSSSALNTLDYGVSFVVDRRNFGTGKFRLSVLAENGGEAVQEGTLQ